jgi:nitrite reductase/ring-hydroxylating ferredoxin subunit
MVLSTLGSGVSVGSAFLGGHLSFGMGVGVNQTAFEGDYYQDEPAEWTAVLDESALEGLRPGKGAEGRAPNGMRVFVFRDGGRLFALSDRCSHRGCALHTGRVRDGNVNCPCHGSSFRLEDGSVVRGPATSPQPAFDVRTREGKVEIRARA